MKKIIYPEKKDWMEILRRPALNTPSDLSIQAHLCQLDLYAHNNL